MNQSLHLNKTLRFAHQEAQRLGNEYVSPEHLVLGMLRLGKDTQDTLFDARSAGSNMSAGNISSDAALSVLNSLGVNLDDLKCECERLAKTKSQEMLKDGDNSAIRILKIAELETLSLKESTSDTKHLLLAIMKDQTNSVAQLLTDKYGITYDNIKLKVRTTKSSTPYMEGFLDAEDDAEQSVSDENKEKQQSKMHKSETPALDSYGIDITKKARQGLLDPVIGRQAEITRVVQILSRRRKNNPILIGDPGVGKSAIVEGLAMRINNREVSPALFGKRIVTLDLASMVAGTKYRGQFEERMKNVLTELQANPDIILFIDEIHNIIGAGNASGSLDAANILKPALSRGDIQCIGATTINEYRQSIEKDGALERRFQKVMVKPTTAEETIEILGQLAPHYAEHHNVTYSKEAIKACVTLTDRYISERAFPDKAIDALDEAGANKRISLPIAPNSIDEIQEQLNSVINEKKAAISRKDFENAVALRDKERDLELALKGEMSRWRRATDTEVPVVDEEDVARVVAMMSGVPVQRLSTDENIRLRELSTRLSKRVVGQQQAIAKISRAIQRGRVGLKAPNRPIGTFLFLGPTGVGKTYLAECLAEDLFGKSDALIRIDMSEYMEKHAVSLLVGAPPGYVAHEDGGKLTEAVRRKPYSIVLFDEIEKAHPDVFNILLQVMDEGRLTDRQGKEVDFKNTIVILTSNTGTRQLKDFGQGIGFHDTPVLTQQKAEDILRKALNRTFAPEFLNRIDNIVVFEQLNEESMRQIVDIELGQTIKQLATMGYSLELTDEAMKLICRKGYDVQYGARPVKRAIQTYVLDALTDLMLDGNPSAASTIVVDVAKDSESTTASWKSAEQLILLPQREDKQLD